MSRGITVMASTFSTNSVNMFYMADNGLIQAMAAAMKDRNLGLRAAASLLDVSHPTLGKVLNGEEASFEFCVKASGFLKIPPDQVFRLAGLLPPVPAKTEQSEQLLYLFNQLDPDKKQELINFANYLLLKK